MNSGDKKIPVLIAGALGRMGGEVVKAVLASSDMDLVGAIETQVDKEGIDVGTALGLETVGVPITSDYEASLCLSSQNSSSNPSSTRPVVVDFTHPSCVYEHTRTAIAYGVHPVIGTTGLTLKELNQLNEFTLKASIGAAIIPNFSIGMVLLQQAAAVAASFYDHAELTELHHNKKADAPSGTCIKTAELMEELGKKFNINEVEEHESIKGSRGGLRDSGLRIHSVRLPGLVAHQEVMFGANGETYHLSHSTIDRSAYMPGVLITIRKVVKLENLVYGLERVL